MQFRAVVVAIVLAGAFVSKAAAGECGSASNDPSGTCACGDTVKGTYTMSANLPTCNNADGLFVSANSTLNCNGKSITGNKVGAHDGVRLSGVSTSVVQNCTITDFQYGVSILDGANNQVLNSTINVGDGTGSAGIRIVRQTVDTTGNTVQGVTINATTYYGIYLNAASATTVTDAKIRFATKYTNSKGVLLVASDENEFINVSSGVGIYLDTSSGNVFSNTATSPTANHGEVYSGDLHIYGESYDNVFTNIAILNGRYRLYDSAGLGPDGTVIDGGSVTQASAPGSCIENNKGGDIIAFGLSFGNCPNYQADLSGTTDLPAFLRVVSGVNDDVTQMFVGDQNSTVEIAGTLDFTVNHNGQPLSGIFVNVLAADGTVISPNQLPYVTDATGHPRNGVGDIVIHQQKTRVGSTITNYVYGPHTVEAYTTSTGTWDGTKNWSAPQSVNFSQDPQDKVLSFTKP